MNSDSDSRGTLSTQSEPSILEASSIGLTAHSRLGQGAEGTIHGAFDGAISMLLTGGLVSLVPEAAGRGPLNITIRLSDGPRGMSSLGIRNGDKVMVQDSRLEFGNGRRVLLGSARIYSPKSRFTAPLLEEREVAANLEVVRKAALHYGNRAGLGQLLALVRPGVGRATASDLNVFASAALPRMVRLEQAFRSEERERLTDAVLELIGLGPGLTPSSDDMLAGLVLLCVLYAKNYGRAQHATRLLAQTVAAEARGRTTILSEEFLRQAALGRGNEPVVRLCTALLTGGRESAERETKQVLAIGATSGTDTVLGVVLGTIFCMGGPSSLAWSGS